MPKQSRNQQNHAHKVGALGEKVVHTFLLQHSDFVHETCYAHPADLFVEFGNNTLYRVQVKTRTASKAGKYTFPIESHRAKADTHATYHCDILAFCFIPDKRIIFKPNNTQQNYFVFTNKDFTDDMELESLQSTLNTLAEIPVISKL
tara:strand:+ start:715 stop:1155 length:441 start_codon:yes stop_codon:yes gene_type:complete